jgi:hypothetical protein
MQALQIFTSQPAADDSRSLASSKTEASTPNADEFAAIMAVEDTVTEAEIELSTDGAESLLALSEVQITIPKSMPWKLANADSAPVMGETLPNSETAKHVVKDTKVEMDPRSKTQGHLQDPVHPQLSEKIQQIGQKDTVINQIKTTKTLQGGEQRRGVEWSDTKTTTASEVNVDMSKIYTGTDFEIDKGAKDMGRLIHDPSKGSLAARSEVALTAPANGQLELTQVEIDAPITIETTKDTARARQPAMEVDLAKDRLTTSPDRPGLETAPSSSPRSTPEVTSALSTPLAILGRHLAPSVEVIPNQRSIRPTAKPTTEPTLASSLVASPETIAPNSRLTIPTGAGQIETTDLRSPATSWPVQPALSSVAATAQAEVGSPLAHHPAEPSSIVATAQAELDSPVAYGPTDIPSATIPTIKMSPTPPEAAYFGMDPKNRFLTGTTNSETPFRDQTGLVSQEPIERLGTEASRPPTAGTETETETETGATPNRTEQQQSSVLNGNADLFDLAKVDDMMGVDLSEAAVGHLAGTTTTALTTSIGASHQAMPAQTASRLAYDAAQLPLGQATEVTLDPPELGRVSLVVTQTDGGLLMTITTERADTLELMRRNSELLAREFDSAGMGGTEFRFSQGGASDHRGDQHGSTSTPMLDAAPLEDTSPLIPQQSASRTTLDLRF